MKTPPHLPPAGLALVCTMAWAHCGPAVGEDATVGRPLDSVSSLAERPVVKIVFTNPYGWVVGDKFREPLMDYLTANTQYVFRDLFVLTSERTIGLVEQRLAEGAQLGVVSYLEARSQFGVVPLARPLNKDGEPVSHSIFVVDEASPLRTLNDLRGRSLALGPFHSGLSNLVPRYELVRAGVSLNELGKLEHLENDQAVAEAVAEGRFDAGAVEDLVAYRYEKQGLRVLHVSDPIPSDPIVVRENLPQAVTEAIRDTLLAIDFEGAKDRPDWEEDIRFGFVAATDADYDLVRNMIRNYPTGCSGTCHGNPEMIHTLRTR